jgi:hypothetical protein
VVPSHSILGVQEVSRPHADRRLGNSCPLSPPAAAIDVDIPPTPPIQEAWDRAGLCPDLVHCATVIVVAIGPAP